MAKLVFQEVEGFLDRAYSGNIKNVIEDVSGIAIHQVSPSFVRLIDRKFNFGKKMLDYSTIYGNMLSVSVPLMMHELIENKIVKRGDRMLIFGGGSGITLGTMYLKY